MDGKEKCAIFYEWGLTVNGKKGFCTGLNVSCTGYRENCSFYKSSEEYKRDINGFIVKREGRQ